MGFKAINVSELIEKEKKSDVESNIKTNIAYIVF